MRGEAGAKTGWDVHAYCLVPNHFHMGVETPRGNCKRRLKSAAGEALILTGDRKDENSLQNPNKVKTEVRSINVGKTFNCVLPSMSVQFIRIKAR